VTAGGFLSAAVNRGLAGATAVKSISLSCCAGETTQVNSISLSCCAGETTQVNSISLSCCAGEAT